MKKRIIGDTRTYAEIFGVVPQDYSKVDVEKLQFKNRTSNTLAVLGCRTLECLLKYSPKQIMSEKDSWKVTLNDIIRVVDDYLKNGTVISEYDFTSPGMLVRKLSEIYDVNPDDFHNVDIATLHFGGRISNCLQKMKCRTLQEFLNYTPGDINAHRGCGKTVMREIREVLDRFFSNKIDVNEITWEALDKQLASLSADYLQRLVLPFFLAFCKIPDETDKILMDKLGSHITFQQLGDSSLCSLLTENEKNRLFLFLKWLPRTLKEMYEVTYEQLTHWLTKEQGQIIRYRYDTNPFTFDVLGKKFNESRQSVQQKESDAIKILRRSYPALTYDPILFCAAWYGTEFITYNQVEQLFDLEIAKILFWKIEAIRKRKLIVKKINIVDVDWCSYRVEEDIYQVGNGNANFEKALVMINFFPETLRTDELNRKITELALQYGIDRSLLSKIICPKYQEFGAFSTRGSSISRVFMREYIFKTYFSLGYKTGNPHTGVYKDADLFKKYLLDLFGYNYEGSGHAMDTLIGKIGLLVHRGTYLQKDLLEVSEKDRSIIYKYIEQGPDKIGFREMFASIKELLSSRSISNRYCLHGVLTKYGCRYYFDRDYIYKTGKLLTKSSEGSCLDPSATLGSMLE